MKVLMDLHGALFGHAGIQQEIRLLFKMLAQVDNVEISGLLLSPSWSTRGVPAQPRDPDKAAYYERLSDFIAALDENTASERLVGGWLARIRGHVGVAAQALAVILKSTVGISFPLFEIDSAVCANFLWRRLFSPSLSEEDWARIAGKKFWGTSLGRHFMNGVGMCRLPYPTLDSTGFDVLIAHRAFPCRLSKGTQLLIRHHDAFPITHPQFNHSWRDLLTYYPPLRYNVKKGNAIFVCNSGPTKEEFVRLFPEAEARSLTIPCVISNRFYRVNHEDAIPEVVRARSCSPRNEENMVASRDRASTCALNYVLAVARLEPRKNYLVVIRAWEQYRLKTGQDLKLIAVADKGARYGDIRQAMQSHLARGNLFHLENVPLPELRILYSHARALISASYAEGFDIPGIEGMLCECPVIASDIKTHRWVYDDAALYFDPDSPASLCDALEQLLHRDRAMQLRHDLTRRGLEIARRYGEDAVRPMWEDLLAKLQNRKHGLQGGKAPAEYATEK